MAVSNVINQTEQDDPGSEYWRAWNEHSLKIRKCCFKWLNGDENKVDEAMSTLAEKSYLKYLTDSYHVKNYFSWMYKIAYNVCIDMHRENKKEAALVDHVSNLPNTFFFSSNASETLEEQIEREQLVSQVVEAFELLSQDLQDIVNLRLLNGKDYADLANQFNTSQQNIRKKVQIARKRLTEYLEKHGQAD